MKLALLLATIFISLSGCYQRPQPDVTEELRRSLANDGVFEVRPRSLSAFDCACIFDNYYDQEDTNPPPREEMRSCSVRAFPADLDDWTGGILLIDRRTDPPDYEIQTFERDGAANTASALYQGCQVGTRARIDARPGYQAWEVKPSVAVAPIAEVHQ